jgi:hypothetical protein
MIDRPVPTKAGKGIHSPFSWIPVFTGMTRKKDILFFSFRPQLLLLSFPQCVSGNPSMKVSEKIGVSD